MVRTTICAVRYPDWRVLGKGPQRRITRQANLEWRTYKAAAQDMQPPTRKGHRSHKLRRSACSAICSHCRSSSFSIFLTSGSSAVFALSAHSRALVRYSSAFEVTFARPDWLTISGRFRSTTATMRRGKSIKAPRFREFAIVFDCAYTEGIRSLAQQSGCFTLPYEAAIGEAPISGRSHQALALSR